MSHLVKIKKLSISKEDDYPFSPFPQNPALFYSGCNFDDNNLVEMSKTRSLNVFNENDVEKRQISTHHLDGCSLERSNWWTRDTWENVCLKAVDRRIEKWAAKCAKFSLDFK